MPTPHCTSAALPRLSAHGGTLVPIVGETRLYQRSVLPTAADRYHGLACGTVGERRLGRWLSAMYELANKRYSHDGMSFKGFIAGPSLPYCAHFPGPLSGADGQGGERAH
jgi:hypothetical protein